MGNNLFICSKIKRMPFNFILLVFILDLVHIIEKKIFLSQKISNLKSSNALTDNLAHVKLSDINIFKINFTILNMIRSYYSAPEVFFDLF